MSPPLIRGIGLLTVGGSTITELPVDLPARKVGDIMFVHAFGLHFSADPGILDTPPGFVELWSNDTSSGFEALWAGRVLNADASLTLTGPAWLAQAWSTQAWTVTNVTPSTTWYDAFGETTNFFDETFPAVTVSGDDRLVVGFIRGFQFFSAPGPFTGPAGFDSHPGQEGRVGNNYFQYNWISTPADTSTPATPYTHDNSGDEIFSISIIGVDDTPLPALPQPGQLRLNCANSYTAWITGPDYRTTLEVVGWKDINWGRILDEPSKASVVIPDIRGGVACCIPHGGIEPWRFGLLIERNDSPVWNGPITEINRNTTAETTTLTAQDFLVRYQKRFAVRNDVVEWINTDAGTAFAGVINTHARSTDDAWYSPCPSVFVGAAVTRHIAPAELEMASEVLDELLGAAVDAFVMNGVLYVWEPGEGWRYQDGFKRTLDGPYNANYDLVFGLFTADAFVELPSWSVNGMSMANFVSVPSADSGQYGFRQIWTAQDADSQLNYGVLDHMEPNTLNLPEDTPPSDVAAVLQARADTYRDLHAMPPTVISGGVLAEGAPVDIAGLIPGSIWLLDVFDACYGQLRTASRLKGVEVSVTAGPDGPVEKITPTMFPPGFSGNEVL